MFKGFPLHVLFSFQIISLGLLEGKAWADIISTWLNILHN